MAVDILEEQTSLRILLPSQFVDFNDTDFDDTSLGTYGIGALFLG